MKELLIICTAIVVSSMGWASLLGVHEDASFTGSARAIDEELSIEAFFCQVDDCRTALVSLIEESKRTRCAFYSLDDKEIAEVLAENSALIVMDEENLWRKEQVWKEKGKEHLIVADGSSGYMHNKFCVFDEDRVMTGSMNPTSNGIDRNDNNMVVISSRSIAANYLHKFRQMYHHRIFKDPDADNRPFPRVKDSNEGILIENHFCPEDRCEEKIIEHIEGAETSIHFMTFSFTSEGISETIIGKMDEIEVRGIFENWQAGSRWSQFHRLDGLAPGEFIRSSHEGNMHHKVFIIDAKTTITGSYNPSQNANRNNDENIIIINDEDTSKRFMREFDRIWEKHEERQ